MRCKENRHREGASGGREDREWGDKVKGRAFWGGGSGKDGPGIVSVRTVLVRGQRGGNEGRNCGSEGKSGQVP